MDRADGLARLTAAKQYATASYAIAVYDYVLTFDREMDTFWRRKFTFPTALWFLNRYTLMFSMFPTLLGFHIAFTDEQCKHFVKFPGAMQIVSNVASGLTLSLRVYALYGQTPWVIAVLLPVFATEIALEVWAVNDGVPAILPPGQVGCILTGKPDQGIKFAIFWIGQLIFPTLIFIMTLTRAIRLLRYGFLKGGLLTVMLRDGIMYFLIIFFANLANVLTYVIAPEDLKFANAPFTNVITTLMICRLMLNLRRPDSPQPTREGVSALDVPRVRAMQPRRAYFGNLGEDLDIGSYEDPKRKATAMEPDTEYARKWVQQESGFELDTFERPLST